MDFFNLSKSPIQNITYHIKDTQQRWFEVLKGLKDVHGVGMMLTRVHSGADDSLEEPVGMGI